MGSAPLLAIVPSNLDDLATRIAALVVVDRCGTERALAIGRLLLDAKAQISRGGWFPFLKRCDLNKRTAQLYMRIASKWKEDDPEAQRVARMALRDVQKTLATAKPRPAAMPPTAFPRGNIAALPTGPCVTCGRDCKCAPAFATDNDEEAA